MASAVSNWSKTPRLWGEALEVRRSRPPASPADTEQRKATHVAQAGEERSQGGVQDRIVSCGVSECCLDGL